MITNKQKIELTELTLDHFVDQESAKKYICSRCNKIIIGKVYENTICRHLCCNNCLPASNSTYYKSIHGCEICSFRVRLSPHVLANGWAISNDLTNSRDNLEVRCQIEKCEQTFNLHDLESHNKIHVQHLLNQEYPVIIMQFVLLFLVVVGIIASAKI